MAREALRQVRPGYEVCRCPGKHHTPLTYDHHHLHPLGWDGPDTAENRARGCPNVHRLAHILLNAMKRRGGRLPHREAVRFGLYAKELAELGWELMVASRTARSATPIPLLPDLHE